MIDIVSNLFQTIPLSYLITILLILVYLKSSLLLISSSIFLVIVNLFPYSSIAISTLLFLVILNIRQIRVLLITGPLLNLLQKLQILPVISDTEKTALEAGSTWVEAECFTGTPNLNRVINVKEQALRKDEESFIKNQCEDLCHKINDWKIHQDRDLSPEIWEQLKKDKFFGLIIPKKYGGLEFTAKAHSEVIQKLASVSSPLAITVMVPNSLGPAELLTHYGTEKQKEHYLPKLAVGEEIPCFGLTELNAGSDAGSMQSEGIVFKENGEIKIRLNWKKRYITLAAISTVIGLAFKLRDPEKLLSDQQYLGITCALIPSHYPGITKDKRHDPLGVPFYNCPISGENVVISIDHIIGAEKGIGKGWKMLMECLAAGRGISLPATCTGGLQSITRISSAYACIREQFSLNIGKFEGIKMPLGHMTGITFIMNAARKYTCSALDLGNKPSVVSAMMKYHTTEEFRSSLNDAMDILGGAAICKGPKNLLSNSYLSAPISITVEGANILTRCLMIFGQGAIRCHPFILKIIKSIETNDKARFDNAFLNHVGHISKNIVHFFINYITRGHVHFLKVSGENKRFKRKIIWLSNLFTLLSDTAMGLYGGDLKRKESLTANYADAFSWLYFSFAVLWELENNKVDKNINKWASNYCLYKIETAIHEALNNMGMPFKFLSYILNLNPISRKICHESTLKLASIIQQNDEQRNQLTKNIFKPQADENQLKILEQTRSISLNLQKIKSKIKHALKSKKIQKSLNLYDDALKAKIITIDEFKQLNEYKNLYKKAVIVDNFELDEYFKNR